MPVSIVIFICRHVLLVQISSQKQNKLTEPRTNYPEQIVSHVIHISRDHSPKENVTFKSSFICFFPIVGQGHLVKRRFTIQSLTCDVLFDLVKSAPSKSYLIKS